MFGCRPLRQFADDRQHIGLVVAGFYHHKNGDAKQEGLQDVIYPDEMVGQRQGQRMNHPAHHQPGGKQVESLEGVEPDYMIAPEFAGCQYDYGGDPADGRDVAKDGGRPWRQARERIGWRADRWWCGSGAGSGSCACGALARATTGAVDVIAVCLMAALSAEWHSY
jgi:hypothetical protein